MAVIAMIESTVGAEIIQNALVKFSLNFVRGNFNPLSSRILRYIRFHQAIFMFFEILSVSESHKLQNSAARIKKTQHSFYLMIPILKSYSA
ncbi:MAG: hypothetical protein K2Y07_10820 [Nitrosomonas sp.]|nr:hypothetical protein [Nitrosomonas sp.]OQW84208.1 MAG: hypothetical protein BVN30_04235 [Proteobacteria bacterium ST_bin16]